MKCMIHGDDEKGCQFYTETNCCISDEDVLDSGNLAYDKLYKAIDRLYERGWVDKHKGLDFDPRGTREWQYLLDIFRVKK